jgi:hypothetical protein
MNGEIALRRLPVTDKPDAKTVLDDDIQGGIMPPDETTKTPYVLGLETALAASQARVEALRADIVGVLAFYGPHLHPRVRETLERIALAAGEPQQGPDEA